LERWDVALYFYGGNIHPRVEWSRRLESLHALADDFSVPLHVRPWDVSQWNQRTAGLEGEPEGGARCEICMRLQLEAAAQLAQSSGIPWLCTSLTLSPQKRPDAINRWGSEIAESYGLRWLERVWRKKNGFALSLSESRRLNLYRQNYCGCRFSMRRAAGSDSSDSILGRT
jgi:predicted adenine nucleotide alpha hydrolase (AANH) superfamily ATPase